MEWRFHTLAKVGCAIGWDSLHPLMKPCTNLDLVALTCPNMAWETTIFFFFFFTAAIQPAGEPYTTQNHFSSLSYGTHAPQCYATAIKKPLILSVPNQILFFFFVIKRLVFLKFNFFLLKIKGQMWHYKSYIKVYRTPHISKKIVFSKKLYYSFFFFYVKLL